MSSSLCVKLAPNIELYCVKMWAFQWTSSDESSARTIHNDSHLGDTKVILLSIFQTLIFGLPKIQSWDGCNHSNAAEDWPPPLLGDRPDGTARLRFRLIFSPCFALSWCGDSCATMQFPISVTLYLGSLRLTSSLAVSLLSLAYHGNSLVINHPLQAVHL